MRHLVVLVCLLLAVPATAHAAPVPESEPNGDLWSANALSANGVIGEISDADDYDIFRFTVRPNVEGEFTLTHEGGGSCDLVLQTLNQEFADAIELWVYDDEPTASEEWFAEEDAVPAVAIIWGDPGCKYRLTASPANLIAPPAAAPTRQQVAEPNESPEQARGPLRQSIEHTGVIASADDAEWMYLNLVPNLLTVIELTAPNPDCAVSLNLYELDEAGKPVQVLTAEAIGPSTSTASYRAPGNRPARHLIEVLGDDGCAWGVRVPTRLGTGPLPGPGEPPAPAPTLTMSLLASNHGDRLLRRRGGLHASCRVNMPSSCQVIAWLPRSAAKRAGIVMPRRSQRIRLGTGRATARKAGTIKTSLRIPPRLRKKLIAFKGGVSVQLTAKATARGQSPVTATKRIRLGS